MPKSNTNLLDSYLDLPYNLSDKAYGTLMDERQIAIRKSNKLIRDFTAKMTVSQFRLANYIIGIAYAQSEELEIEFDIKRYCEICGLDYKSGKNYKQIKSDIKKLSDRSLWVEVFGNPDVEVLVRLIAKSWIYSKSGIVKLRLDEDVKQYISALAQQYKERGQLYTSYEFLYTLPMHSVYSMRLYELLKSWATRDSEEHGHYWKIDDLKELLDANYDRYQDFRRFILDKSIDEINKYTDLDVSYEPIKQGRNYVYINFYIQKKPKDEIIKIQGKINNYLDFGRDIERAKHRNIEKSTELTNNNYGQTSFTGCEGLPEPPVESSAPKKRGRPKKAR